MSLCVCPHALVYEGVGYCVVNTACVPFVQVVGMWEGEGVAHSKKLAM